ncbi:hypothetical protein D3C86_1798810 [compost metagenome]
MIKRNDDCSAQVGKKQIAITAFDKREKQFFLLLNRRQAILPKEDQFTAVRLGLSFILHSKQLFKTAQFGCKTIFIRHFQYVLFQFNWHFYTVIGLVFALQINFHRVSISNESVIYIAIAFIDQSLEH